MLRHAVLPGLILAACTVLPARAQMATYCSGVIQAVTFDTQVLPGPAGRAIYSVRLRNASGQARSYRLVVTAPLLGRPPPATQSLAPGGTAQIVLGYAVNQPGHTTLRANELAEVVRITCG